MKVVITGGTGLVGGALVQKLSERGDDVTLFTRRPNEVGVRTRERISVVDYAPREGGAWQARVDGQDAVLHFAGERAVGRRFTDEAKREIVASRVETTRRLVEAIGAAQARPAVFVCASAVGYYGHHHGAEPLAEDAEPGREFLSELCVKWEEEAERAAEHGVRVVRARLGIVLAPDAPALKLMALPFRMFAGGTVGDGGQVLSWVHLEDAAGIILRCLDDASASGPVNVTAPHAVSYAELARTLGSVMHRPSWFRVPKVAVETVLGGEASAAVLGGQRAVPAKMERAGYRFRYPRLREALVDCLERNR